MTLFTKILALWIPFDGTHFHYGDDDPMTPIEAVQSLVAAICITAVIACVVFFSTAK